MFILVSFGESMKNGMWNLKHYNFETVLDAVTHGEKVIQREGGDGFVVISSDYSPGKNDDEMTVVYRENADHVKVQTFPYICVKKIATECNAPLI